ncbi:hypothetical protein BLSTO_00974 [Blastocystis sp. subtype 1]
MEWIRQFYCSLEPIMLYCMEDLLGGPKPFKVRSAVNLQRSLIGEWALHGSYGLIWLLKSYVMPDLAFEKDCTIGSSIAAFVLILIPYWVAPYLIAAGYTTAPSYPVMAFCVLLHTLGVAVMMVSDAQKYYTLQHKKQLITDGMYRYIRSPNYLGEVMIYSSYALLANHWLPWLILLYVWSSVFATRIITKEKRMERYPEWKSYKARTNCIVPIKFFMHFFQKAKDE